VLDGLDIPYNVDITASDVTVRRVRIRLGGESFGISLRHTADVTITDSEIIGASASGRDRLLVGIKDLYGDSSGLQVLRTDVSRASTGIQVDGGLVRDCYIHDLGFTSGDHVNGITSNASDGSLLSIVHNTVFNGFDQTDAVSLFEDFGRQANRIIASNLLAGGGYTLYAGANPGGAATSDIRVTGNRFARLYHPGGGSHGPVTAYESGPGNVWSANIWDEDGAPVTP
jgi:hypothetical protein